MSLSTFLLFCFISAYTESTLSLKPGLNFYKGSVGEILTLSFDLPIRGWVPYLRLNVGIASVGTDSLSIFNTDFGIALIYPVNLSEQWVLRPSFSIGSGSANFSVSSGNNLSPQFFMRPGAEIVRFFGKFEMSLGAEYQISFTGVSDIENIRLNIGAGYYFGNRQAQSLLRKLRKTELVNEKDSINNRIKLNIPDVLFKKGSAEINPEFASGVSDIARTLQTSKNYKIQITGYTDNTGSDKYNLKLSLERAKSVAALLVANGIDGKLIGTSGMGKNNPIASNDSEEGRKKNRRVEISIDFD